MSRKFSLEQNFMNYKVDDLLYGFLRSLSTARPTGKKTKNNKDEYEEYLIYKDYVKNKKTIAGICGCSVKTVERHLNDLGEKGLISDEIHVVKQGDKEYEYRCLLFPIPEGSFKIIEKELLRYLLDTRNAQCIKVYLYLLSKYEWKTGYTFTLTEINKALGYAPTTNTTSVNNIVESLAREGIIEYEDDYDYIEQHGEVIATPVKRLNFVAKSKKQLPKVG